MPLREPGRNGHALQQLRGLRAELIRRFEDQLRHPRPTPWAQQTLANLKAGDVAQIRYNDLPSEYRPDGWHSLFELDGDQLFRVAPERDEPAPPRDVDIVDEASRSYRVVCLYRWLLCDAEVTPVPDPELHLLTEQERAQRLARHDQLVTWRADNLDALQAGLTVTIPSWRVQMNIWRNEVAHVPWLTGRSVSRFTVTADDVVTPV